jgi:hypothetical protein
MTDTPFRVYVIQGRIERDYSECQAALAAVPARMTTLSNVGGDDDLIARARDADALVDELDAHRRRALDVLTRVLQQD